MAAASLMAMGLSACGYEAGGSAVDAALAAGTAQVTESSVAAALAPGTAQVTESSVRSPSQVDDQVAVPVKESAPAPAAAAGSWIDTLVNDMKWFHDGPTAVLEAIPAWGSGASWPEATARPSGFRYAQAWTHTTADTSHANGNGYPWRVSGPYTGNQAPNTRVQQRDIQMWWLLSNGQWVLGTHNSTPGDSMFELNWSEGTIVPGAWRDEASNGGGASMRSLGRDVYAKRLWHAWASPHPIPDNAIGAATAFFSRLILDNPSGPDDRHLARILSAGAGDWYRDAYTPGVQWQQGVNIYYMGYGRLKYVTRDWQLHGWTSLSEAQIRANPPPFIGLPN